MNDEFQPDDEPRDLLGDPVSMASEHLGRPSFEKTEENQETVRVLKAAGWKLERIARYLGCDVKTLRKHFSHELSLAVDQAQAEALLTIHRRMKEGNVSAARQVLTLADKGAAAPPPPQAEAAAAEVEDAGAEAAKLGKKERQAEAAKKPTGDWGNLLPVH